MSTKVSLCQIDITKIKVDASGNLASETLPVGGG